MLDRCTTHHICDCLQAKLDAAEARIVELEAALGIALPCVQALEATQRAMGHDYICTREVERIAGALEPKGVKG